MEGGRKKKCSEEKKRMLGVKFKVSGSTALEL
jgi:hypothetical protein